MKFILLSVLISVPVFASNKIMIDVKLNPAGSFQATSENLKGDLIKNNDVFTANEITVDIKTLKTGIDLRDEHFWKHLNFEKHGKASITNLQGQNGKATALLEVAGVKKPLNISYKESGNNIIATFKVRSHDYKLPDVDYMGIGVEDEVSGEVTMTFKTKSQI